MALEHPLTRHLNRLVGSGRLVALPWRCGLGRFEERLWGLLGLTEGLGGSEWVAGGLVSRGWEGDGFDVLRRCESVGLIKLIPLPEPISLLERFGVVPTSAGSGSNYGSRVSCVVARDASDSARCCKGWKGGESMRALMAPLHQDSKG